MKKLLIFLMITLLFLGGCQSKPQEGKTEDTRKAYLKEELGNKIIANHSDYEVMSDNWDVITVDGEDVVTGIYQVIYDRQTKEYIKYYFGCDDINIAGDRNNDVFVISDENMEENQRIAKEKYPVLTSKTDWYVTSGTYYGCEISLTITLTKDQINDESIINEIIKCINNDQFINILKKRDDMKNEDDLIAYDLVCGPNWGVNPFNRVDPQTDWFALPNGAIDESGFIIELNEQTLPKYLKDNWGE